MQSAPIAWKKPVALALALSVLAQPMHAGLSVAAQASVTARRPAQPVTDSTRPALPQPATLPVQPIGSLPVAAQALPFLSRESRSALGRPAPSMAETLHSNAAPLPPEPLLLPDPAIVPPEPVGYLPASWSVVPTGHFTYTVPLDVPPGRAGMHPELALRYSSSVENGLLGVGWSLAGLSEIRRCGRRAGLKAAENIKYDNTDDFCLDGQRLTAVSGLNGAHDTEYRTELDTFARVRSVGTSPTGPEKFIVHEKNGLIHEYHAQKAQRFEHGVKVSPAGAVEQQSNALGEVVFVWVLKTTRDRPGNEIRYEYTATSDNNGMEVRPHRILYTFHGEAMPGHRSVQFHYDDLRPDKEFAWQNGVRMRTPSRLTSISMHAPNPAVVAKVWEYQISYLPSVSTQRSLVASIKRCTPGERCLWAKQFKWHEDPKLGFSVKPVEPYKRGAGAVLPVLQVLDLDGNGADDIIYNEATGEYIEDVYVRLGQRDATGAMMPLVDLVPITRRHTCCVPGQAPNFSLSMSTALPVDFDANGATELWAAGHTQDTAGKPGVSKIERALWGWDEVARRFQPITAPINQWPTPSVPEMAASYFLDLNGDRTADLVWRSSSGRFFVKYSTPIVGAIFADYQAAMGDILHGSIDTGMQVKECGARVGDVDGDGRGDLMMRQYAGGLCSTTELAIAEHDNGQVSAISSWVFGSNGGGGPLPFYNKFTAGQSGFTTLLGDWNGDGLQDTLLQKTLCGNPQECFGLLFWNTGNGLLLDAHVVPAMLEKGLRVGDIDSDGRDDLIEIGDYAIKIWRSRGDGTFVKQTLNEGSYQDWQWQTGYPEAQLGDFNGDGLLDILTFEYISDRLEVLQQNASFADRLKAVSDEPTAWAREEIEYKNEWTDRRTGTTRCLYPTMCLSRGMTVVRMVTSRAHLVNPENIHAIARKLYYSYDTPIADVTGEGFLGFDTFRIWDPARPEERVFTFDNRTQVGSRRPFLGRPASVTTVIPIIKKGQIIPPQVQARVTRQVVTDYDQKSLNGGKTYAVFPKKTYTKEWEQLVSIDWTVLSAENPTGNHIWGISEPENPPIRRDTLKLFDHYGNVVHEEMQTTGATGQAGVSSTVVTSYDYTRSADWLINLPSRVSTTSKTGGAVQVPATRQVDYTYTTLGQLDTVTLEKGNPLPGVTLVTALTYDPCGVVTRVSKTAGSEPTRVTNVEYAPTFPGAPDERVFSSQVWAEHDIPSQRPSQWTAIHPAYGVVVAMMGADGVQVTTVSDAFGRPVQVKREGQETVSYAYHARPDSAGGSNGLVRRMEEGDQRTDVHEDALGRAVEKTILGFDGATIRTRSLYDSLGRLVLASRPFTTSAPSEWTRYTYDSLDRLVQTERPDGSVSKQTHSLFETWMFDANNFARYVVRDLDGRVVSSANVLQASPSTTFDVKTQYVYGPFDQVERVIDAKGNQTAFLYDVRGNRVMVDDLDKGPKYFTYNGFGELTAETPDEDDPAQRKTYQYDDLGRLRFIHGPDGSNEYVYDGCCGVISGRGKLTLMQSADGVATYYHYDQAGRPVEVVTYDERADVDYAVSITYDAQGRPKTLAYPVVPGRQRFTLQYDYNEFGYLRAVSEVQPGQQPKPLWQVQARNLDLALTHATIGHGVATMSMGRSYNSLTGRLQFIGIGGAVVPTFDVSYDYWPNGLLKSRNSDDGTVARHEKFQYDALSRLTEWELSHRSGPISGNEDDGSVEAGFIQDPTTRFGYNTIGNLVNITKNAAVVENRSFGTTNGRLPHAVTSVSGAVPHSGSYLYDQQGRQISGGGRTNIRYTTFDLPKTLVANGQTWEFAYDAVGRRVAMSGPNGSTTYIGDLYEKRAVGKSIIHVFRVHGSEGAIAEVAYEQPASGVGTSTVRYLISDALGTVSAVVEANGAVSARQYFSPFGARIHPDGSAFVGSVGPVHTGLTGHEYDDALQLVNMAGRLYDPRLASFMSPDPVIANPWFGQSWNPYSYVHNSPLNLVDPSGFSCVVPTMVKNEFSPGGYEQIFQPCPKNKGPRAGKPRAAAQKVTDVAGDYAEEVAAMLGYDLPDVTVDLTDQAIYVQTVETSALPPVGADGSAATQPAAHPLTALGNALEAAKHSTQPPLHIPTFLVGSLGGCFIAGVGLCGSFGFYYDVHTTEIGPIASLGMGTGFEVGGGPSIAMEIGKHGVPQSAQDALGGDEEFFNVSGGVLSTGASWAKSGAQNGHGFSISGPGLGVSVGEQFKVVGPGIPILDMFWKIVTAIGRPVEGVNW